MFENAGLNRLGLEESASKLHSDETQAKALHSTTKQKLLLAQRNFKLGTKNRALFHMWATKSNLARKEAYVHIDAAKRMAERAEDASARIRQLEAENRRLE